MSAENQESVDQKVTDNDDAHRAMTGSMGFDYDTAKRALACSNRDVDVALDCPLEKDMSPQQETKNLDTSSISKKKTSQVRKPQHIPWSNPNEESGKKGKGKGLHEAKGNDIPASDGRTVPMQCHEQGLAGSALPSRAYDRALTSDEPVREHNFHSESHPIPRRPGAEAIEGMGSSGALPPGCTHRPSNLQPRGEDVLVSAELVADVDPEGPDPPPQLALPGEDIPNRRDIRRIYILIAAIFLVVLVAVVVAVAFVFLLGNDESTPNAIGPKVGQTTQTPSPGTSTPPIQPPTEPPTRTPPSLTYCGFTMLEGYDLLGSDITLLPIPLNMAFDDAVKECKDICLALPSCDSFTLVDKGAHGVLNNPVPWCFVKDSVPTESSQDGMYSGIKTSTSCSRPSASYDTLPSTDLLGNDLFLPCVPLEFATTLDTATKVCQDICSAMSRCEAYSAVDPDIGPAFSGFGCCIKGAVSDYEEGSQPLVSSAIKV